MRALFILLAVVLVLGAIGAGVWFAYGPQISAWWSTRNDEPAYTGSEREAQYKRDLDVRYAARKEAIAVTAEALHTAYRSNAIAADETYNNRAILISGKISGVRDIAGAQVVALEGGGFFDVLCAYAATGDRQTLLALKKGQRVSMLCVGSGTYVGDPVLADCTVEAK